MTPLKIASSSAFEEKSKGLKWLMVSLTPVNRADHTAGFLLRVPQKYAAEFGWTSRREVFWFTSRDSLLIHADPLRSGSLTRRAAWHHKFGMLTVTHDRKNVVIYIAWRKLYTEPWPTEVRHKGRDVVWASVQRCRKTAANALFLSLEKYPRTPAPDQKGG